MKILSSTYNTRPILKNSLRFIRSDVPTTITENDKRWLLGNNIKTIIDLRTKEEQNVKQCPLMYMDDFIYHTVSLSGGKDIPASPELVPISYINMVDEKLEKVLDIAFNAQTNVLYFCNMGKDRTGVVSAAILRKLGFDDEYIITDYVATYENVKEILKVFASNNPQADINVITPKGEYMRSFLNIYNRHSSEI